MVICVVTGLLQVVKQYIKIPVYVMIRPRGGDFLYSDYEIEVMKKDIELMKLNGANGLVLGALTEDGRVDAELCLELLGIVLILIQPPSNLAWNQRQFMVMILEDINIPKCVCSCLR